MEQGLPLGALEGRVGVAEDEPDGGEEVGLARAIAPDADVDLFAACPSPVASAQSIQCAEVSCAVCPPHLNGSITTWSL